MSDYEKWSTMDHSNLLNLRMAARCLDYLDRWLLLFWDGTIAYWWPTIDDKTSSNIIVLTNRDKWNLE